MDNEYLQWAFNNFNSLCDKAKFLIFQNILKKHSQEVMFFDVFEIEDDEIKLSPIEQILCEAIKIYELDNPKVKFRPIVDKQTKITAKGKTYVADFIIQDIYLKDEWTEVSLNEPIIIECDGYEWHSSKSQINRDYERENDLKLAGYNVFRFTGSQIYNNPYKCVKIIYEHINSLIKNNDIKECK